MKRQNRTLKASLTSRILFQQVRNHSSDKLKKEYNFKVNPAVYEWFVKNSDTLIIQGISKYDRKKIPSGNIYTYSNQKLSAKAFADYLEKRSNMVVTKNPEYYIDTSIESILSDEIMNYEKSVLEKKYPDFKYLMLEFHDGILLFDISSKKVWNKAQEDSAGLFNYYEQNKNNYLSKKSIEGNIYTLRESGGEKKLASAYKKYSRKGDPDAKTDAKV